MNGLKKCCSHYHNIGRPAANDSDYNYVSAYTDLPNIPQFPFGYGLSYTTFAYSDIKLSNASLKSKQGLTASVTVTNTGQYKGKETIQLYIHDISGRVVRPVKELKGLQQVELRPGESKIITFSITTNDLLFYGDLLKYD
jgi:beta-glucosidase